MADTGRRNELKVIASMLNISRAFSLSDPNPKSKICDLPRMWPLVLYLLVRQCCVSWQSSHSRHEHRSFQKTEKSWGESCNPMIWMILFGCGPLIETVTTRIITFLIGNPNLNLHFPLASCDGAISKIL